ncbi:hypothetical protein ANRL4_02981 [Anaerolineae bacterium]|nr:hypothetical protein ANRL4_02981 [Anaerolineae bacterium]
MNEKTGPSAMTLPRIPSSRQADNLMKHMCALYTDIGPRALASPQERQAADSP